MKLALIQTKQNELYNFPGTRRFEKNEALRLRGEYMDEVLRLVEEAAKNGADLIVTTEAVNFKESHERKPWGRGESGTSFRANFPCPRG